MKTIKEMHAHWAAGIMPKEAPQIQRQEMERAFYSGFYSALIFLHYRLSDMPEDDAVVALDGLHLEAEAYFKTLGQAPIDIARS